MFSLTHGALSAIYSRECSDVSCTSTHPITISVFNLCQQYGDMDGGRVWLRGTKRKIRPSSDVVGGDAIILFSYKNV